MKYEYKPTGVCAQKISFDIDGDVISNISFLGGCNGNLKAVAKLCDGMNVEYISSKLAGNICGMKGTSCADQLAKAVVAAYESQK